jgi:hypothetical protein
VPQWLVERVAAGDLPAERLAALRAEIAGDAEAQALDAGIAASNAEVLAALPPAEVAAEVARRARVAAAAGRPAPARAWWRVSPPLLAAAVAAAGLALWAGPWLGRGGAGGGRAAGVAEDGADVTRVKGVPHLLLYRKRGSSVERLQGATATARAGDRIQLAYVAAGARFGAVLSIDGAGVVTLHFPESERGSTRLAAAPGRAASLPHSYQLDDAPAFERFFFVTSAAPIDVAALLEGARRIARDPEHARRDPLSLPPHLEQWSLLVRKGDAP